MAFTYRITRTWNQPFYTGSAAAVSQSAVRKWDVVLNGIGYMLDLQNPDAGPYKFESVPMLHAMFIQDRGTQPIGEHSLTPYDYWRRSVDDWSAGSGQLNQDHTVSVDNQYRLSKGIDPWTIGEFSMLNDTTHKATSANTNLKIVVAGTYLYYLDGSALKYTTDLSSFTTVTGTALSSAVDLTSDGNTVYLADANRVYYTTRGAATRAAYHTVDHVASLIQIAKGRLITADNNILYTHSGAAGSAVATVYYTHPNSDWTWTSVAEGNDVIYFAGFSGHLSMVYAATIKSDGTALDVPVVVATLPTGEVARSMRAYFSVLVIGTDKGFRAAAIGSSAGQLTLGSLVKIPVAPRCFETNDRFVWFGWSNYDGTSTGLGRIDLSVFNGDVPAYASDLMATTQGIVSSVVTFTGIRVFTVQGHGIYAEDTTNKVTTATLYNGWLGFALADSKLAIKFNLQTKAGGGTIQLAMALDDQAPVNVGLPLMTSAAAGNNTTIQLPQMQARNYEPVLTLTRSSTDHTQAPVIDRYTLMVEPQPERRVIISAPLLFHSTVMNRLNQVERYEPQLERRRVFELLQSREIVPFQDVETTYPVLVDDFHWIPYEQIFDGASRTWDGTMVVALKIVN